jgi:hypothetical protein
MQHHVDGNCYIVKLFAHWNSAGPIAHDIFFSWTLFLLQTLSRCRGSCNILSRIELAPFIRETRPKPYKSSEYYFEGEPPKATKVTDCYPKIKQQVSSRLLAIPHWLTASASLATTLKREHIDDGVDLISLSPPPNIYITQCCQTRRWPWHLYEASYELKMSNHLPPECLLSFPFVHLLFTF